MHSSPAHLILGFLASARFFHGLFSSSSPVAILPTMTAAPITSARRFSPRGPLGILVIRSGLALAASVAKAALCASASCHVWYAAAETSRVGDNATAKNG